jgi:unsaturated chondroitin disaccharide hydrolase
MINLELLFWAAKNGGGKKLYDIAVSHANHTMKNQFKSDYSCYHVALYDTITGKFIKGITHQGYSDKSMWARGQAWSIYGFTLCYRETHDKKYLEFALKVADAYLKRLPYDEVPYWDFDAPQIPNAPRDASAACVVASALLEMSTYLDGDSGTKYKNDAVKMLKNLSTPAYLSGQSTPAYLMHSTGHWPNNSEIDASIIYADYYYIEALLRLKKLNSGEKLFKIEG